MCYFSALLQQQQREFKCQTISISTSFWVRLFLKTPASRFCNPRAIGPHNDWYEYIPEEGIRYRDFGDSLCVHGNQKQYMVWDEWGTSHEFPRTTLGLYQACLCFNRQDSRGVHEYELAKFYLPHTFEYKICSTCITNRMGEMLYCDKNQYSAKYENAGRRKFKRSPKGFYQALVYFVEGNII